MRTTTTAAWLCASVIATPAFVARADATDTTYLNELHGYGITSTKGDQSLIEGAHMVCSLLADGVSMDAIVDASELGEQNGMTNAAVTFMTHAAAVNYCPMSIP